MGPLHALQVLYIPDEGHVTGFGRQVAGTPLSGATVRASRGQREHNLVPISFHAAFTLQSFSQGLVAWIGQSVLRLRGLRALQLCSTRVTSDTGSV